MTTRTPFSLLACLLALAGAACGGGTTPPPAPPAPASLAVTASTTAPLVDTSVTITARVLTAGGAPVAAGTPVTFVASGGALSDVTATDGAGDATAQVRRATRGTVTVFVTVGALPPGIQAVTFIDPDEPAAVALSAAPGTADVGAAVVLTARVIPAGASGTGDPGATIADGTVVTFTSSAGTVSSVTATSGGEATAILSGIASPGVVWVTASAGSVVSLPAMVEFVDREAPAGVTVTGAPPAGLVGGQGPVTLTATVLTLAGTPVPPGTPVAFVVTAGAGSLSAAGAPTDGTGRASVTLVGAAEGAVTVAATAAGPVTGSLTIPFTNPNRLAGLSLVASPQAGMVGGQGPITLTAILTPADPVLGRIADGTPVTFAVTGGSGTLSSPTATTAGGVASVTLDSPVEGSVTIRVAAGPLSDTSTVAFSDPGRPVALTLAASPTAGRIDLPVAVTLTAILRPADPVLGRIADGTLVAFAITAGSGALSAQTAVTSGGVASVTLAGAVEGGVSVLATAGPVSDSATVAFGNPSRPVALSLVASPRSGATGGQGPVTLTAVLTPADPAQGRIADGTVVTFAITAGSGALSAPAAATSGGVASVTLDGAVEGSVTVSASAGAVSDGATVAFTNPSRPAALSLAASPRSGATGGQGPVTLTATLSPADPVRGRIADGTVVAFAVTAGSGTLSARTAATSGGLASVTLDSAVEGSVTASASAGAAIDGVTVTFTNPSRPAAVSLVADPPSGVTAGQGPVTLSATVTPADPVRGRIPDGTVVTFAVTAGPGTLSSTTAVTTGGVAAVTLNATSAGGVGVEARAGTAPAAVSPTTTVPFLVQPRLVIVTLRTTGPLPAGAAIGGVSAVVTAAPAAGLSLTPADVSTSGAATGAMLVANTGDVAAGRLAMISATGLQPGEFATVTYRVAAGAFPTEQDFGVALSGPGVIDTLGQTIPLGVSVQAVSIQ